MNTGSFVNWAGNISDIGVLYPFEGTEIIWVMAAAAYLVYWQIGQIIAEQKRFRRESKFYTPDRLKQMVNRK